MGSAFALPHPPEPDVGKIAVLRANGLGDLVFSLPALEALRAAYPEAELVLLGKEWARELLAGRPGPVDRVVAVPQARGVREDPGVEEDPDALAGFLTAMRAEGFDLAVQMHGGGRHSNPFVRALGARLSVGPATPDAPRLDRPLPYVYLQPEVLRYLELVALVGAAPVTLTPRLAVTAADREEAARVVGDAEGQLVLLHPGASDPRRCWPAESFAAVGERLAERGACVLVNGGPAERGLVEAVLAGMDGAGRAVSLGLAGLVGVCARSAVVVANDTGPLHLAGAVGAPTVGLYWGPNAINSPSPGRARHRALAVLDPHCPDCGVDLVRGTCEHDSSLVAPIRPEEVTAAAEELMGLAPGDPGALERALDPRAALARAPVAAR